VKKVRGVESIVLDFSVMLNESTVTHSDYLPNAFLSLAGECGVDIELSHYPVSE
jgi:hypothetical protein